MRFLLSSPWWSSQEYHGPMKLHTCAMTKVKNFKKPRPQQKVEKLLCKICSMCENLTFIGYLCEILSICENMAICVKIWLSLDICVKYAQCVKIWPFVWKFDFHWIFVWNMLNVWKYGHLMSWFCFWCVCSFLKPCVQFFMDTILNLTMCSVSSEEKGRHALTRHVTHLRKRETRTNKVCLTC
jgi:hypothetical protein